jgi:hypothetical protein
MSAVINRESGEFSTCTKQEIKDQKRKNKMKRRIILSIALTLSIISVLLMNSDSSVGAQNQTRYAAGTGIITPGANQNLSLTINGGSGDDAIAIRFRRTRYVKTDCAGGVCRYIVESQTTSDPMILMPDEAGRSIVIGNQIGPDAAVSIEVLSSSRNARATMQLTDALTGQVQSVLIALLLP